MHNSILSNIKCNGDLYEKTVSFSFVSEQKPVGSKLKVSVDVQPILN